jgi:hypothetical protein
MLNERPRPAKRARNLARTRGCGPPVGSCEKSILVVTPVKTWVQALYNLLKRLDTGFRRYDGKGFPNDFFTRSYPRAATSLTKEPPGTGVVISIETRSGPKKKSPCKHVSGIPCHCMLRPKTSVRWTDARAPSPLKGEGRGEGDTGKALRCSR